MNEPKLIAEIGCNHKGSMAIAKEMIQVAALYAKVPTVKFQKRNNRELLGEQKYNAPHPDPRNSYGPTYGAHRDFLEFSLDQHRELKEYCEYLNVEYSTSVWDMSSAREITSLNPRAIKIPSAINTNFEMLNWLCDNYGGEIHISTGMSTTHEIDTIMEEMMKSGRNKDLVLYHCISGYPVAFEDSYLLEIRKMVENYASSVKEIGFSGHHLGIAIDIAAYTLGARIFERHFTLDRTWKGTDHAASLEPDGLRKLNRDLVATHEALRYKPFDILPLEEIQRKKLKYQPSTVSA